MPLNRTFQQVVAVAIIVSKRHLIEGTTGRFAGSLDRGGSAISKC